MINRVLLFLLIIPLSFLYPQRVKLNGEIKQGNIVIGQVKDATNITLDEKVLQFDSRGYFVFGIDRDATGISYLKIKFKNGDLEITKLEIAEREYEIQKINNMKQKYITPPKKELARIKKESEMMKQARKKIGEIDSAYFAAGFIKPVDEGRITGVFGSQRILNGVPKAPHNGVDFAAPAGAPVYAASDGKIIIAGNNFYYNGNFVMVDHGQGLSSVYLHMRKLFVKDGQQVRKGEKIGEIGTTGRSTGAHLHWGVQWYSERIDPESLLNIHFN